MYGVSAFFESTKPAAGRLAAGFGVLLAVAVASTTPASSATEGEIGTAVVTVKRVTGYLGQQERPLSVGERVHLDEILETGPDSHAELELDDDTKLALGPNGRLILDDYVFSGSDQGSGRIALNVLKGAFRFITGENDKDSYRIDTPSATIGVLGTVFDLYVIDDDETVVLLLEGSLEVCSRTAPGSLGGACRSNAQPNQLIYSCANGVVSDPIQWSDTLIPGVAVSTAFPFLQDAPQLDPVQRASYPEITDESAAALQLIEEARARCRAGQ